MNNMSTSDPGHGTILSRTSAASRCHNLKGADDFSLVARLRILCIMSETV